MTTPGYTRKRGCLDVRFVHHYPTQPHAPERVERPPDVVFWLAEG